VVAGLLLAAATISIGSANTPTDRILLPIEVLGADGTTVSRTVTLKPEESESVRSLWLQIHGVRYADQASVQINTSAWIPLSNDTVSIAEPGKSFGGIGSFATLVMTLPLPGGTVVNGVNTIRFRFNQTDGVASGYRVLAWNLLTVDERKILPKTGHLLCLTRLLFWLDRNSGGLPRWLQAASQKVREFKRIVQTVMHRMVAT
jgi:hypothetical protein